jgi:hypothetical protein
MKLLCALLLLALPATCMAGHKTAPATVNVKIEASEWDKNLLLEKLNDNGSDHHLRFVLADQDFEYRITFSTGQEKAGGVYGGNASTAATTVFDAKGVQLFSVTRGGRLTDKGAANAVAEEIVKRLIQLRSSK